METFEKIADLIDTIVQEMEEHCPIDKEDAWNLVASEQAHEYMDVAAEGRILDEDGHFFYPAYLLSNSTADPSSQSTVTYELQSSLMTGSGWKGHFRSLNTEQENIHSFITGWCSKSVQSKKA